MSNGSRATLTLLTDFGLADTYVGQMRGVLLGRLRDASIVDLTHGVEPGAVDQGAYLLERSFRAFPQGTVHVAVVDPGVGTARRAIAATAHGHGFVGPDNGLLCRCLEGDHEARVVEIMADRVVGSVASATFHGRDLFAPAAARLAQTGDLSSVGDGLTLDDLSGWPVSRSEPRSGRPISVAHVDRFGNVALDLLATCLPAPLSQWAVETASTRIRRWQRTFGDAADDSPFLLVNSSGDVEIAIRGGSAADRLDLAPGDPVTLRRLDTPDTDGAADASS